MFVMMKSQSSVNLGQLGSKTVSLGQFKEIPCGHSRGHISSLINLKFGQDVYLDKMNANLAHLGLKTRSLCQIKEIPCGHSRGHISCSIDLKCSRNVCLD